MDTFEQYVDSLSNGLGNAEAPAAADAVQPAVTGQGSPVAPMRPAVKPFGFVEDFFGVYLDPRTWGALVFMLLSLVTGIVYFTWAVTGLALSVSLLILIIGLPFAFLFLLSVRGLGLLEAGIVGVLLGVRLQPRPIFAGRGSNLLQRLKVLAIDKPTWLAFLYLVLQMPLGVIYFSVTVVLIAFSLAIMAAPFAQILGDRAIIMWIDQRLWVPAWGLGLMEIAGFLVLTVSMNVVRAIGRWHARYAAGLLAG